MFDLAHFINARQLRTRYGGVSHMWIERRLSSDPTFPKPRYVGTRRFWLLAAIENWERANATKSSRDRGRERSETCCGFETTLPPTKNLKPDR